MTFHSDTYSTQLGTEFKFAFEFKGSGIEILIVEQPGYADRSDDNHITHRIPTDDGFKICWTGQIRTLNEAKSIAARWSFYTERYILTGQPFPEQ